MNMPTSEKKWFLQYLSHENRVLRAPDVRITIQKSASKVTWKQTRKQNRISRPRGGKAFKMESKNHSEIAKNPILDPT